MDSTEKQVQRNSKVDKVILEKIGERVVVTGPYSKKQLRNFLLSSISLPALATLKSRQEIEVLEATGVSKIDLQKLQEGKTDELSEDAKEKLKYLEISEQLIKETLSQKGQPEGSPKFTGKLTLKEAPVVKTFQDLLREKGLSGDLIKTLMQYGLTDELIRLLKALGFTDEEIAELQKLYENEKKNLDDMDSLASTASSSEEYLSPDGLFLKHSLREPLVDALQEIVAKKPFDPVEYLAHYLLHHKVCEERKRRKKEFELELMIEREKIKMQQDDAEDEMFLTTERGEEEHLEDWNYLNYEGH